MRSPHKLLRAVGVAGALLVAGCGDSADDRPAAGGNGVDRAFVADMVPHHEAAIEMARFARQRGESEFVKELADDIARSQSEEVSTMRTEDEALETAGVKRGSLGVPEHLKGMDHDTATLRTADPFDPAFIRLMIPHHEGALEMSAAELAKGEDPELRALAQDIIDAQEREIAAMREHLGQAGSSEHAPPDGGQSRGHSG